MNSNEKFVVIDLDDLSVKSELYNSEDDVKAFMERKSKEVYERCREKGMQMELADYVLRSISYAKVRPITEEEANQNAPGICLIRNVEDDEIGSENFCLPSEAIKAIRESGIDQEKVSIYKAEMIGSPDVSIYTKRFFAYPSMEGNDEPSSLRGKLFFVDNTAKHEGVDRCKKSMALASRMMPHVSRVINTNIYSVEPYVKDMELCEEDRIIMHIFGNGYVESPVFKNLEEADKFFSDNSENPDVKALVALENAQYAVIRIIDSVRHVVGESGECEEVDKCEPDHGTIVLSVNDSPESP